MTLASVLDDRYARWANQLFDWGYIQEDPPRPCETSQIRLRARRREDFGGLALVIDVAELWQPGEDPDGVGSTRHGCYLVEAGWHAQFEGSEAADAERLDVDRLKPAPLIVHRHPLGEPNHVREPATLGTPEEWLATVEGLI